MKKFLVYLTTAAFLMTVSFAIAKDEKVADKQPNTSAGMEMAGTAKIVKGPAVETIPMQTVATAFVKSKDYAPAAGYGEKEYDKAYEGMMMNGFGKLGTWIVESKCQPTGPGFAVWNEDPMETKPVDLTAKTGFPVDAKCEPTKDVVVEKIPEYQAVTITYGGHYKDAGNAWKDIMVWAESNGYKFNKAPVEVFQKGPNETQNADEWVTQIVWGVERAK